MKVRFYKAAEREFDEAVRYYESQLPGLGGRYRQAVREAVERIKLFPEAYAPLSKRTRRCLVGKFPYGIIFPPRDAGSVRSLSSVHVASPIVVPLGRVNASLAVTVKHRARGGCEIHSIGRNRKRSALHVLNPTKRVLSMTEVVL